MLTFESDDASPSSAGVNVPGHFCAGYKFLFEVSENIHILRSIFSFPSILMTSCK